MSCAGMNKHVKLGREVLPVWDMHGIRRSQHGHHSDALCTKEVEGNRLHCRHSP